MTSLLTYIVPLTLYLLTLAPNWGVITIFNTWDGLEYTLAAALLGIDHPPGHPLYLLLGKLFTFLPLGGVSYRLNLLSALFGALTVFLLYLGLLQLFKLTAGRENKIAAAALALSVGFSYLFWSHVVIPEVHALFLAEIALALWFVFKWLEDKQEKWLDGCCLVLGLAQATIIFNAGTVVLGFLAFFFLYRVRISLRGWLYLSLPPLIIYMYYPLRAWQQAGFIHPMNFSGPEPFGSLGWFLWFIQGQAWTGGGMFDPLVIARNLPLYFSHLFNSFSPLIALFVLLALPGLVKNKALALIGLVFLALALPELAVRFPAHAGLDTYNYFADFYLYSYFVLAYLAAAGVNAILTRLQPQPAKIASRLLLLLPLIFVVANYQRCDLRTRPDSGYQYAQQALSEVPARSLILSKLIYQQVSLYFAKIEPRLQGKRLAIASPDSPLLNPGGVTFAARIEKSRRLKQTIAESKVPVFLAGDCVEEDKAPENLLLADLDFYPVTPRPVAGRVLSPELILYEARSPRAAVPVASTPPLIKRDAGNQGNFGGKLKLAGFQTTGELYPAPGRKKSYLEFYWQTLADPGEDLFGVIMLLDSKLQKVDPERTAWYFTLGGARPSSRWRRGQLFREPVYYYPPTLPPGQYFLGFGLLKADGTTLGYSPADSGQRFDFVLLQEFLVR
jgi:hypothetical protein